MGRVLKWFYRVGNEQRGPVPEAELRRLLQERVIDARTLVWSKLLGEWTPAGRAGLVPATMALATDRDRTTPLRPRALRFSGGSQHGDEVELGDRLLIGRSQRNDLVLGEETVSGRHASIELQGSRYLLTDLGSTNGTWLNGERLSGQAPITIGDTIRFGSILLEVMGGSGAVGGAAAEPVQARPVRAPSASPPPSPGAAAATPDPAPRSRPDQQPAPPSPAAGSGRRHHPGVALVAGLLIPGAGQAYNGQAGKALLLHFLSILVIPWGYSLWDGWQTAGRIVADGGRQGRGGPLWILLQAWLLLCTLLAVLIGLTITGVLE